jgi:hypothetical protein
MAAVNPGIPQSLNLYSYSLNDPLNNTDRVGLVDNDKLNNCDPDEQGGSECSGGGGDSSQTTCANNGDGTSTCFGGNIPEGFAQTIDNTTGQVISTGFLETVDVLAPPSPPPLVQADTPGFLPGQFTPAANPTPACGVRVCWASVLGLGGPAPQILSHWWIETTTTKAGMGGDLFYGVAWTDQSNKYDIYSNPGEIQCKDVPNVDAGCLYAHTMGDLGHWYPTNTCQDVVNQALAQCYAGPAISELPPPAGDTFFQSLYYLIGGMSY